MDEIRNMLITIGFETDDLKNVHTESKIRQEIAEVLAKYKASGDIYKWIIADDEIISEKLKG